MPKKTFVVLSDSNIHQIFRAAKAKCLETRKEVWVQSENKVLTFRVHASPSSAVRRRVKWAYYHHDQVHGRKSNWKHLKASELYTKWVEIMFREALNLE